MAQCFRKTTYFLNFRVRALPGPGGRATRP